MKFFSKQETIAVSIILFILFLVSFFNFRTALRRARDSQRRGDLGAITDAFEEYKSEWNFLPLSSPDLKLQGCKPDNFDTLIFESSKSGTFDRNFFLKRIRDCEWGVDNLMEPT